ncbi:MAG TPA: DUF1847 domain-containing protein [Haloplasmataceae bacterium]
MYCAFCEKKGCYTGELDINNNKCPSNDKDLIDEAKKLYHEEENHKLAYNSALVESSGYGKNTRLEEIIDFANRCGFKRLGVAFCIGLKEEAKCLCHILKHHHFEVISVVCKNASIPKEFMGIKEDEKVRPNTREAMCNPIMQAMVLNKAQTELNILLGLCVGHDTLFIKYSKAPITVFAVKDRVLAHNPLGAIYLANSYYKKKLYD